MVLNYLFVAWQCVQGKSNSTEQPQLLYKLPNIGTTFTLIGSRARKRRAAFSSNVSVVPTPLSNLTFCKILTSAIFISRSANRMPIHWRGPWLKGMYEKDGRFLTSLGRKRSGSNFSGCTGEIKYKRLKSRKSSID